MKSTGGIGVWWQGAISEMTFIDGSITVCGSTKILTDDSQCPRPAAWYRGHFKNHIRVSKEEYWEKLWPGEICQLATQK